MITSSAIVRSTTPAGRVTSDKIRDMTYSWTSDEKAAKFLGRHLIPVILGPKYRHFIIDHHH